jgi:hypothetical protein
MVSLRVPLVALPLVPLLAALACKAEPDPGPQPLECPATGAVLLEQTPLLEPEQGAGCEDSESWTSVIDPAPTTWTIEAIPVWSGNNLILRPYGEGVVLGDGTDLHVFDGDGELVWQRGAGANLAWSNFVTTADSRFIVANTALGGGPQYRVLDSNGIETWLRLLDTQAFTTPVIALDGDELLINLIVSDPVTFDFVFRIQRWNPTGTKLGEFDIPTQWFGSGAIAVDGAGNIGVDDQGIRIFDSSGAELGLAEYGDDFPAMFVGSQDEGFFSVGGTEQVAFVRSYAPDGALRWSRGFGSEIGFDRAWAAAGLADGGVVIVGVENNIAVVYPDSGFIDYNQPFVLALDSDGNPTWGERLATSGTSYSVSVGAGGEVYVAGKAQTGVPSETTFPGTLVWLRRYDP